MSRAGAVRSMRWVVAGALAAVVAGCGLFKPETPVFNSSTAPQIIPNFTSVDSTLRYMALAIQNKSLSNGQAVYTSALADSLPPGGTDPRTFRAFFDPTVYGSRQWTVGPNDWDYAREVNFYGTLVAQYPEPYVMTWQKDPAFPDPSTPATAFRRHYLIQRVISARDSTTVAVGTADLWFVQTGSSWKLYRWDDSRDPEKDPNLTLSMSALRLRL